MPRCDDNPKVGDVLGCVTYGPCSLEPHHPDLFWYGVHGVETLFTIMGTGCESVSRARQTKDTDLVTGVWKDGRVGTFRGLRSGSKPATAWLFSAARASSARRSTAVTSRWCVEIVKFFRTGKPPVSAEETIEMFAFMEAADESNRAGGTPVKMANVIAKAREEIARKKN